MPMQLRKLIKNGVFEKVKDDGMNPVIKYKGKKKHQKIKDREYHTFEIVNILTKDGEEVNKPPTTTCLLYTSPSPRDMRRSRMPSSA